MNFIPSTETFYNQRSIDKVPQKPPNQDKEITLTSTEKSVIKPKLSFAGFGKSGTVKLSVQAPVIIKDVIDKPIITNIQEINSDIIIFTGRKVTYGSAKKPRLNQENRKIANWGDLMISHEGKSKEQRENDKKREKEREADIKTTIDQTIDLFGAMDTDFIAPEEPNTDILAGKVTELLDNMNKHDVVSKRDKNSGVVTLATEFFSMLYSIFDYLNPEERGKLLITIIFGGLISRGKLSKIGGKSGSAKFLDLIGSKKSGLGLNALPPGGQNPNIGRVYTKVTEIICSVKLARYRDDVPAADQVNSVIELVNKLNRGNKEIYFPSNFLFSDPVLVVISKVVASKVVTSTTVKSAYLNGTPIIENLNDFFANEKEIKVTGKTNGNNNHDTLDSDESSILDKQDRLANAAYSSKGGRYEDRNH